MTVDWIKDFMKPEFIWAMVGLILLLMEFTLPGLIIFFFGVGAWIVAATCFFMDIGVNAQLSIFITSSVVLLVALRQWLRSVFVGHTYSKQAGTQDMNDLIGERVTVTQTIAPPQSGAVELHGVKWNATAETTIEAGQLVEITGQDNLTLTVKTL
jgi:membrane protein implicated in regulation of membrane protease activity